MISNENMAKIVNVSACKKCNGQGRINIDKNILCGCQQNQKYVECNTCKGKGEFKLLIKARCYPCNGCGYIETIVTK